VRLLVDSTVWIDFFGGRETAGVALLDASLGHREIVVGDIILTEVLQGFRFDRQFRQARSAMLKFPVLDMVGRDVALRTAENYRRLRRRGVTVRRTLDCLIATFCIQNGLELLHADRDFDPFERWFGLHVARP
jgi:hypothetical protein